MATIHNLTDCEIRAKLTDFGYPVLPITATTRKVLLKKLKYLLGQPNIVEHETHEVISPISLSQFKLRPSCEKAVSMVSRSNRPRQILHPKRSGPGSGTVNTFGSFNKPETSFGVTSTELNTSSLPPLFRALLAAKSQPTTAGLNTTVGAAPNRGSGTVSDKFVVMMGTDIDVRHGVSCPVRTQYHCITFMKEYESMSLEELRLEDYIANTVIRTRPRQGMQLTEQPFEFGVGESSATTRLFGSTNIKPLVNQTNTSIAVQQSLFGATTTQPTDVDSLNPIVNTSATKDVFSIEVLKQSIEKLEEIVQCAVCLEVVKPTIMQCANGHLICSGCKTTLDKCPSCRAAFSDNQPSRLIEQIIEAFPSRCMWPNCKLYFKSGDDHELFCEYRLTRCMWDDCQWSGCRSEIYHHISTVHKVFDDKTSTTLHLKTFPLDYFDPNIKYSCSTVYILFDGQIIKKKTVSDPVQKLFTETFYLFPKGKPQKDIYGAVRFTSRGPKFVCKIKLNLNEDALEENTIHVPWHMLPNFLDNEKRLQYNIYITEE